ncbi:FKBP-type peptidyl-prolyl cis-trans isomerase [Thermogemmatispora carboxidivorans]|uniref:FKBP-type peptidyl-prolyl cis-trans isomerase n=1 Tax=Thermogemmatispora carboxidivorans TaxID=1382306 RepID=UPI000AFCD5B5|nr:FKBP-type peptidyl-prolyl cis-trans isomerase [Thermogemmatispora carboxidivorans]
MTQTEQGKKGGSQKLHRPGQRQQERIRRQMRRRRRQQLIIASTVTLVIIILAGLGFWQYQRVNAQQAASREATATAVSKAHANATATVLARNCFIDSSASAQVPSVYSATATPTAGPATSPAVNGTPVVKSDGLKYFDIRTGSGTAAKNGSTLQVEYVGWLANTCKKFDSSYDRNGQSFSFTLGKGEVIKGWDEGLVGVKPGTIRRLYIPAKLGYGNQAQGSIPANSDLIFDVIVLSVK